MSPDSGTFEGHTAFDGRSVSYRPTDLAHIATEAFAIDGRSVSYRPTDLATFDIESFMAFAINLKPTHHPEKQQSCFSLVARRLSYGTTDVDS